MLLRSVAQPGSALVWGASGRGFKSRRSDQLEIAALSRSIFMKQLRILKTAILDVAMTLARKACYFYKPSGSFWQEIINVDKGIGNIL